MSCTPLFGTPLQPALWQNLVLYLTNLEHFVTPTPNDTNLIQWPVKALGLQRTPPPDTILTSDTILIQYGWNRW